MLRRAVRGRAEDSPRRGVRLGTGQAERSLDVFVLARWRASDGVEASRSASMRSHRRRTACHASLIRELVLRPYVGSNPGQRVALEQVPTPLAARCLGLPTVMVSTAATVPGRRYRRTACT